MTAPSEALDTLGTAPLPDGLGRDAIHLAVIPAIAEAPILPGAHVAYDHETLIASRRAPGDETAVGIVDPFLTSPVLAGERFWLIVYPRTVTSLRHEWEHPAIPTVARVAPVQIEGDRAEAEAWLRANIGDHGIGEPGDDRWDYGDTFETVVAKAESGQFDAYGDGVSYLLISGTDAHGAIPHEFWRQVEIYVGHPITNRATYWSCSC